MNQTTQHSIAGLLHNILKIVGLSEAQRTNAIQSIDKLIAETFAVELLKRLPEERRQKLKQSLTNQDLDQDIRTLTEHVQQTLSLDEIDAVRKIVTEDILADYVATMSEGLSDQQKQEIEAMLAALEK